ncbi:MAG: GlsB/YeaQ/YmgE family stress response membrane protein [Chloroflexi bacterium]|nr:GlsB/YeaQ/YmgE family stress response membrane protein [Chloroflexota bacterium]
MGGCLGFIVMLIMLSVLGWLIDLIVPGRMPYGWLGGIVAAIIGGLIGGFIFGNFGPAASFGGWTLSFIPALLGGIILGFIVRFVMGSQRRSTL